MKILHVVPSFGLGGMEKIICAIINGQSDIHEHIILPLDACSTAVTWITNARVEVVPFEKNNSRSLFFTSLYTTLRQIQPKILMTYNWGATDAIWLGRLVGLSKIVHNEHGFNVDESNATRQRRNIVRRVVFRLVSKIVVVSHHLELLLRERFRLRDSIVTRIPNGIDTEIYCPNKHERQKVRCLLGYQPSDVVIGFCGRLDPIKNLDMLLDIFQGTTPSDSPFRLLIVGDGPERLKLEARCSAAGFQSYVKFVGQKTDVLPYLRAMDVFALTSVSEQMPLTVLEAMGVGLPVITTRVGELPYIIEDGSDGFIRDLTSPTEAFVQPLYSLLCSLHRKQIGDAARKKIVQQFQLKKMIQDYNQLIQSLIYK